MKSEYALPNGTHLCALALSLLLAACGSTDTATVENQALAVASPSASPSNVAVASAETSIDGSRDGGSNRADAGPTSTNSPEAKPSSGTTPIGPDPSFEADEDHPIAGHPEITRKMLEDAVAKHGPQ